MFFKWNNLFFPLQVYNPNRKTRGEKLEKKNSTHLVLNLYPLFYNGPHLLKYFILVFIILNLC